MRCKFGFFGGLILLFLMPAINDTAQAYLGPGAGLGMIGGLIAIVIVILVIVFGLIFYPIRRYFKRKSTTNQS